MKSWSSSILCAANLVATPPAEVRADSSAAGLVGYGLDLESTSPNPFGLTLAARAGDTYPFGLYLGGAGALHRGGSARVGDTHVTRRMGQLGVELGYEIALSDAVALRPYGGFGLNFSVVTVKTSAFGLSETSKDTELDLYVAAGATLLVAITEAALIGCEVRSSNLVTTDPPRLGVILLGTVGARF